VRNIVLRILKPFLVAGWACLDGLVLSRRRARNQGSGVLLVRVDAIGDFVLWSDAARALCDFQRAQGRSVVLLANKSWASWAQEMGIADEVWALDTRQFVRSLRYRRSWLKKLRTHGFAVAIGPTYSREFLLHDSLIRATGAPERIGYYGDCSNISSWCKAWSDRWYTRLIANPAPPTEIRRNAEFVRAVGPRDFVGKIPLIQPSGKPRHEGLPARPYTVLFPGASWIGRAWPVDSFAEIGRRLLKQGYHIVVAGGPSDASFTTPLVDALRPDVWDLSGKTSLSDLAEVLRDAAAILTNETSALHIGAAVGTPVVCILGGGHFGRFAPYDVEVVDPTQPLPSFAVHKMECFGCNWHCHYSREKDEPVKCIREITVEDVWRLVERALPAEKVALGSDLPS
jgi:ADP-heptose:LPS heptosyltransferase